MQGSETIGAQHSLATKKAWKSKCSLKSHMDSVRALYLSPSGTLLASASEDCSVKLWDISGVVRGGEIEDADPYVTLRGHRGPLFSMTGAKKETQKPFREMLYTAG